jgi:hypothetical protein
MVEVWENIIKEPQNLRFVQADYVSPYCEAIEGCIKEEPGGIKKIEINSFYRYDSFFAPLLEGKITDAEKQFLFDILMHLAARLELKNGLTKREFAVRRAWDEIESGAYGKQAKNLFEKLDEDARYLTAQGLVSQNETGESVTLFCNILIRLLSDGVIYKNSVAPKELLLYISRTPSSMESCKIEIAKELFLPLGYQLRIYERDSFGVMGEELSMVMDEIVLF